jgi:serine/threonine-protein kinase
VQPDIDPALERVVHTALARNPEQRFSSAADLLEALVPFGAGRTPFERAVIGRPSVEDERRRAAHLPTLPTPAALRPATPRPPSARSAAVAATIPAESLDLTPSGSTTRQAAGAVRATRRRAGAAIAFVVLAIVGAVYFTRSGTGSRGPSRTTDAAAPGTAPANAPRPEARAPTPQGLGESQGTEYPAPRPPLADRPLIPAATILRPPDPGTTVPTAEPPTVLPPPVVPPATPGEADAGEADHAWPDAGRPDAAPVVPRDAGPTRRDAGRREPDAAGPAAADAGRPRGGADGLITVHGHTVRTNYEEP